MVITTTGGAVEGRLWSRLGVEHLCFMSLPSLSL